METKTCNTCQENKDVSKFYKDVTKKDGIRSQCKLCVDRTNGAYMKTPKGKEYSREWYVTNRLERMVSDAKQRAKDKGIPFDLEVSDIIVPEYCPFLGIPLAVSEGYSQDGSLSLDRIVPERGYVPDNVQVISHRANTMKSNASLDALLTFARSVIRMYGGVDGG